MRHKALHRHAIYQVCILSLLLSLSLFLRLVFFFLGVVTFAGTRVLVCWNSGQNDVVWSLWDIKRRCFALFYFFKPPPPPSPPKRHRFGMCRELKKNTAAFQNDVVLYHKRPKRRRLGCRTLEIVFFLGVLTLIFALFQAKTNPNTPNNGIREEGAENQPK